MNPPPALFGAMNRERKPFTYTPGGLDLSEIKSERMAKRLMRNAMNQGVSEVPGKQVQSPPANPIAVPNFNCLPVQVFPTINLPANPKSLLRTRSNPDNPKEPIQKANLPSQIPKPTKAYNNSMPLSQSNNNNFVYQRPVSMYEQISTKNGNNDFPRTSYGGIESASATLLPEICYEAEYFQTAPIDNSINIDKSALYLSNGRQNNYHSNGFLRTQIDTDSSQSETKFENNNDLKIDRNLPIQCIDPIKINSISTDIDPTKGLDTDSENVKGQKTDNSRNNDFSVDALTDVMITPISAVTSSIEDKSRSDDEKKEVKVIKKQVKKETKSEVRSGEQNGDTNAEAELTVKLPAKKSAAKTETNVEVVKQQLPDGSLKEIKTTTTKTTVDGKTTIATKTETKIIPKEEEEEVEEEVEEEEEEEEEQGEVILQEAEENAGKNKKVEETKDSKPVENGVKSNLITNEERSESTSTKKVTIVQSQQSEEEEVEEIEEEEEEEEAEKVKAIVDNNQENSKTVKFVDEEDEETNEPVEEKQNSITEKEELVEEEEELEEENVNNLEEKETEKITKTENDDEQAEEEEEEEKTTVEKQDEKPVESMARQDTKEDEESEYTEEEYESEKEDVTQSNSKVVNEAVSEKIEPPKLEKEEEKPTVVETAKEPSPQPTVEPTPQDTSQPASQPETQSASQPTSQPEPQRVPLREPSIPLEKVEDVEIKPIGPVHETITKSHSENTEIIRTERPATGPLSTQTEYNRVENIVTVNRTTKTLDQSYENITQHGVPTVKTYFAPTRERVSTSPQPSKPFEPTYSPVVNQPTERRHSLLLERLSMERQLPTSDIYQNNYQNQTQILEQQRQWSQEPQAEVLTVSNVKPSTITNQQWYQQSKKDNIIYNNTTPAPPVSQPWNHAPMPQQSPQPQQQPQHNYTESNVTNSYQQNDYQSYKPKPAWGSSLNSSDTIPASQPNQYSSSFLNKNSKTESIHKTTQQYSSSYVPPPWEQDSNYVDLSSQSEYQPPPSSAPYSPNINQSWAPTPPKSKFTKPPPTAYIPPAPNQSFVKPVTDVEPPRVPGKKTYYSEYERRYITVPESTYIPGETKFQPQPDPSPQYYYDNNEPSESVEPQWRKELREFTEKTSQTHYSEQVSVKPPWEEDPKYAKAPTSTYTPTPTWSQTLRPRSWRERSFESEYVGSQNAPKSNTLGRGRPLSSYGRSNVETIPERPRGVSVDRYNPNSYQSPVAAEHPPVQTHVLNVVPPAKSYHNPNVPAYHTQSRASAEPREQSATYQHPRQWGEARASPIQSRSFKYLQWITGTED